MEKIKAEGVFRYALQLAYLNRLLTAEFITEQVYTKIKKDLMNDYHIVSDILAG